MESSTTIRNMMAGNKIVVPAYQRAYSWDTPAENWTGDTQTDVFLSDLEEFSHNNVKSPYYFGHFLFEVTKKEFKVIDGQQRLTTIVILLCALFARLEDFGELSEAENISREDMVKRRSNIGFSTVDYDNQLFIDYVIDRTKSDHHGLETESSRRIVRAFDYFKNHFSEKPESYLKALLSVVTTASCSTHPVKDETEAIQMFIFQNNRGKKPSNLEIIKAQFMHHINLHGEDESTALMDEVKNRFGAIYKSISSIEYKINEDDVLLYTLRVHFNSLSQTNSLNKINSILADGNQIQFIQSFTRDLTSSFNYLSQFFGPDEQKNFSIHSLITLGGIGITLPFIIKAYTYNLDTNETGKLCASLESLLLRHRLIGTRANITSRINDVFKKFTKNNKKITPIVERIEYMKKSPEWWWAYWSDDRLKESLQGNINRSVARFLLWKYEIHLKTSGKDGYHLRYDQIERPELEHIAPIQEPNVKPHGYDTYDEEFCNQSLNCLGNYLLLSKSHNASIHNDSFPQKHKDYKHLEQQREIQELVPDPNKEIWGKKIIQKRKGMIIDVIMRNC